MQAIVIRTDFNFYLKGLLIQCSQVVAGFGVTKHSIEIGCNKASVNKKVVTNERASHQLGCLLMSWQWCYLG